MIAPLEPIMSGMLVMGTFTWSSLKSSNDKDMYPLSFSSRMACSARATASGRPTIVHRSPAVSMVLTPVFSLIRAIVAPLGPMMRPIFAGSILTAVAIELGSRGSGAGAPGAAAAGFFSAFAFARAASAVTLAMAAAALATCVMPAASLPPAPALAKSAADAMPGMV